MPFLESDPMLPMLIRDSIKSRNSWHKFSDTGAVITRFEKAPKITREDGDGNHDIVGIASTTKVDSDAEVIIPGGIDFSYWNDSPKSLFADHSYTMKSVLGTVRYCRLNDAGNALEFRARVFKGLDNPLPGDFYKMLEQGAEPGISVGLEGIAWGPPNDIEKKLYPKAINIVRKSLLVELTATFLQSNTDCGCRLMTDGNYPSLKEHESIGSMITKGLIKKDSAQALGLYPEAPRTIFRLTGELPVEVKRFRLT